MMHNHQLTLNYNTNILLLHLNKIFPTRLTLIPAFIYNTAGSSKACLHVSDNSGITVKQISLNGSGKGIVNIEASTLDAAYMLIL
jgi:hypothetical protein